MIYLAQAEVAVYSYMNGKKVVNATETRLVEADSIEEAIEAVKKELDYLDPHGVTYSVLDVTVHPTIMAAPKEAAKPKAIKEQGPWVVLLDLMGLDFFHDVVVLGVSSTLDGAKALAMSDHETRYEGRGEPGRIEWVENDDGSYDVENDVLTGYGYRILRAQAS